MTTELNQDLTWKPRPFLHWCIFIFTAVLGMETGAGLFTSVVVFPVWTASAEAVIGFTPEAPYFLEEGDFFMFASPSTFLLSIIVLIASWRAAPELRKWLRIATILFIIVFVWSVAYFIPVQAEMKGEPGSTVPVEELESMLRNFVNLNYIRQLMLIVALIFSLHALGISYRMRDKV